MPRNRNSNRNRNRNMAQPNGNNTMDFALSLLPFGGLLQQLFGPNNNDNGREERMREAERRQDEQRYEDFVAYTKDRVTDLNQNWMNRYEDNVRNSENQRQAMGREIHNQQRESDHLRQDHRELNQRLYQTQISETNYRIYTVGLSVLLVALVFLYLYSTGDLQRKAEEAAQTEAKFYTIKEQMLQDKYLQKEVELKRKFDMALSNIDMLEKKRKIKPEKKGFFNGPSIDEQIQNIEEETIKMVQEKLRQMKKNAYF